MQALAVVSLLLLLFAWIGYPALVAVVAMLRKKPAPVGDMPLPRVSVILATRESDAAIRDRVADVARAAYPRELLDVVVALDAKRGTSSVAVPLATDIAVTTVVGEESGGKATALNAGVQAARGEVLVFTDSAQRFDPSAIGHLVRALQADGRLGVVSGALHIDKADGRLSAANLYWAYERRLRELEARAHSTVGVTGCIYAMWRKLWVPLPRGLILDDVYAPMQLTLRGYRVGFCRAAVARDARHFEPVQEYRRKARTLTGVLQLCAWLPAVLVPARNPIWAQFVSHKLLRMATPYLVMLLAVGALAQLFRALPGPAALYWLGAVAVLAVVPALVSRRVREAVLGVVMLQAAVLKAAVNAIRGEWDVWQS